MKKKDLIKVRRELHRQHLNWLPNWQLQNKEALKYFKRLPEDGGTGKIR
jgi:hypothetical protein